MKNYDVLIIGAGVAGITASIYCARANLKVALIDKGIIGGNLNNYMNIENYPGFFGETSDLVDKFIDHLNKYDNIEQFEFEEIEYVNLQNKVVKTKNNEFQGKYIIIATGSKPKMLGVEGEREYIGNGVHYCAICDGILYKDKIVAVIGGGNSACEEALGLAKICEQVYLIEFTDKLNAEQTTINKIKETKNIEVCTGYALTSIEKIPQIELDKYNETGNWFSLICKPRENFEKHDRPVEYVTRPSLKLWVNGVFPYIGMSPCLPELKNAHMLDKDSYGYIFVDSDKQTTVDNIYAIGDITHKDYRQVITAMSDGAIASIHISKRG